MHGGINYDYHFIVRQLACDLNKIDIVQNSSERYVTFLNHASSEIRLRFLGNFRFLDRTLSQLPYNLAQIQFYHVNLFFDENDSPDVI